ncbi:MAG: putative 4-mercaptohistidine N1-methyltransferase [Verrucomicrobiota bacterium]|jgi:putative 4-mercaptohistidine N1-methyltranferase|nr:putative 4-mercaptohistidine N1-methyltransferase [Verrucomicrobiota bacterium]
MPDGFYETSRALSEYLLFHYGKPDEVLPWDFGPTDALDYPVRCVTECVDTSRIPDDARALDLGCAVGRSTFELARHCTEVIGIDLSESFIHTANQMQKDGQLSYQFAVEGELGQATVAEVPSDLNLTRVRFEQGDATFLRDGLGQFDVILMANLIDRLPCPADCLRQMSGLIVAGGQLIITTPCTWLEEYTPRTEWLGGSQALGQAQTLDALREILSPDFILDAERNLPFLIREHARKYQWSVAQATRWIRLAPTG